MPTVRITPNRSKKVPYHLQDEVAPNLLEELAVAGNTAELQKALGAQISVGQNDMAETIDLFNAALQGKDSRALLNQTVAQAAAQFLRDYGQHLAYDVAEVRNAITTKLMEIANCGDMKYELKALELLGKHSDIGLFTERSEITVNYKTPQELEDAIKTRVKRLLHADRAEPSQIVTSLEEELNPPPLPPDASYEVIPDEHS